MASTRRPQKVASVFKIAHHRSRNGHHDGIWRHLLAADAVAVLTPLDRGSKLPTPSDLTRIASLTPNAFLTSAPRYKKKSGVSVVDRTIREKGAKLTAIEPPTGYV